MTKGSDLLVAALENEGVERIFGVPGEENLDVVELLRYSADRAGADAARASGRLHGGDLRAAHRQARRLHRDARTGRAEPLDGAAYAHLGAMPMILITGQKGIMTSKQARFQIVDVVATMRPLTKMARQIVSTATIPTIVRDAFRVAHEERPGPVHLELPEDIAGEECADVPLVPAHPIDMPVAHRAALDRAAEMILAAERPLIDAGRRREPPALDGRARGFRPAHPHPLLHDADGQGHGAGRDQPLYGHRGALRPGLRA